MQFVSGWIVDSFDVNRVIAAGFLLWSLATAATGLVRGFHDAAGDAVDSRHRRVCDVPRLLENPQLPFAGTLTGASPMASYKLQ